MENFLDKIAIMIPSLNPDESLIKYVASLKEIGFNKIIIVNDGSKKELNSFLIVLLKWIVT